MTKSTPSNAGGSFDFKWYSIDNQGKADIGIGIINQQQQQQQSATNNPILLSSAGLQKVKQEYETGSSNKCKICKDRKVLSPKTCEELEKLVPFSSTFSVEKLCKNIADDNILHEVANQLNSFMPNKMAIDDFFKDINENNQNSESISKFVPQLNRGIVKAWKLVYDAKLVDEGYKKDYELLKNISTLETNSSSLQFLGGNEGLTTILQKNTKAPCKTCDYAGKDQELNYMSHYIKGIESFAQNHRSKPNTDKIVRFMKGRDFWNNLLVEDWKIEASIDGNAFMLAAIYNSNLTINEFEKEENSRRADIILAGNIRIDCKSWKYANIKNYIVRTDDWAQFLDYFKVIAQPTQLEYWFNFKKCLSNTPNDIKNIFKDILFDPTVDLFNPQGRLKPKGEELFNTIWMNQSLRVDLFQNDGIDFTQPDNIIRPIGLAKFQEKVNSSSNTFYNFIKVK